MNVSTELSPRDQYWMQLDLTMPWMTEFALKGDNKDLPRFDMNPSSPLLDADPYFERSGSWEPWPRAALNQPCDVEVCSLKENQDLILLVPGQEQALRLKQPMSVVRVTEDYVFLSADDAELFRSKAPSEKDPDEGVFFIARKDLREMGARRAPIPVFFLPLPDAGWTGRLKTLETEETREIVFVNQRDQSPLPVSLTDVHLIEKTQRDNLLIGITWAFMDGERPASGFVMPKPKTTVAFGSLLSGRLSEAETNPPLDVEIVRAERGAGWRDWILPSTLWGSRVILAAAAYTSIDWSQLIPPGTGQRIETVAMLMGSVALATVMMRFTAHRKLFAEKYKKSDYPGILGGVNRHHKALLDEFAHASYFSLALIPQGMRHFLEFLKDRGIPGNKWVHQAWDQTFGYQLRQNSRLAMNWKTWWLGVCVYGLTDSMAVFMDMLIFAPWLASHFGWSWGGTAMAAWASSEVLRNFISYLQAGAHSYSADVKGNNLESARKLARRRMQAEGLDPANPRNQDHFENLVETELEARYRTVGLPKQNEFLYDPNVTLQSAMSKLGYSAHDENLTDADRAELAKKTFILQRRHWGLVKPSLRQARRIARELQAEHPSLLGEQTVKLFEASQTYSGFTKATLGRIGKVLTSQRARQDLAEFRAAAVDAYQNPEPNAKPKQDIFSLLGRWARSLVPGASDATTPPDPTAFGRFSAAARATIAYFTSDAAAEVRDQRMVMFLMSTTDKNPETLMKFLPRTWIERAGSEKAAYLGARLFNRAFMAYVHKDQARLRSSPELEAEFAPQAEAVLNEAKTPIDDPFERAVLKVDVLQDLKEAAEGRKAVETYEPPEEDALARKQWAAARAEAERAYSEHPITETVSRVWNGLARKHAARTNAEIDRDAWIDTYRYRTLVARAFGEQVRLNIDDPEISPFVRGSITTAAVETEQRLSQESEVEYLKKLSDGDRRFYEAKIYTTNLISAYVSRSVHSDEHLEAADAQYPGRFQKWRREAVGPGLGRKVKSIAARLFETGFRNEETSYQPGRYGWFERNIPLLPDMWINLATSARSWPYILTLSYVTMYYVWQIHSPYALMFISVVTGFWHPTLVGLNNRLMRGFGIQPMANSASKATYSFTHGTLTNVEPVVLEKVADPIQASAQRFIYEPIGSAAAACAAALL